MEMRRLHLGRSAWPTLEAGAAKEWLETNGLGGWAFGTVPNVNTRFYHAVLAPALRPPSERLVLLARLEESLLIDGRRHPLSCNMWSSGAVEAGPLTALHSFSLDPFPTWTYVAGDVVLVKQLFMRHGFNTTVIRYRLRRGSGRPDGGDPGAARPIILLLSPLTTCRSIHTVARQSDWPFAQEQIGPASVSLEPYVGSPRLFMAATDGAYTSVGEWVNGFCYAYEALRGEPTEEDLYLPGRFEWACTGDSELTFVASVEPIDRIDGPGWEAEERHRRNGLLVQANAAEPITRSLVLAADQFIVARASTGTATVIAGYPWFTDWGRDTMIALHGLTLSTRRYHLARELLHTFAAYEHDGLIPNCFPEEGGEPLYNTADASLWFFEAAWQYLQHTADDRFVRDELYPVLLRIAETHVAGTRFDIGMTRDGLLRCGNPQVQVTWMDARDGDWVVTPRDGYPVEIQALWHNALRVLATLCSRYCHKLQAAKWATAAQRVSTAFDRFWNTAENCCFDRLRDDGSPDRTIRPNQVFALTLSFPLLHDDKARRVVDLLFSDLWTPYGLRSLSPRDPAYRALYLGNRRERDSAYHQGTVWAWLTGPFITAYLRAYGRTPDNVAHGRTLLDPLLAHLQEFGLGTVAETFDGDPPHTPRACVAQAWSVAELLRVWQNELRGTSTGPHFPPPRLQAPVSGGSLPFPAPVPQPTSPDRPDL